MAVEEENNEVTETEEVAPVAEVEQEEEAKAPESEAETTEQIPEVEEDEVIVTFGNEETPPPEEKQEAPEWVKDLRKKNREQAKELRQAKEKLKSLQNTEDKPVALGAKPTLESCDYDEELYSKEIDLWYDSKKKHDETLQKQKQEQDDQAKAWNQKLENYEEAKTKLKVKDFDEAEETVLESLSETHQGIILQGAENAALVIYAIGKNPELSAELSSIKDPVKFAFAVAKMESKLKVTSRKAPPKPEKTVISSAGSSSAVDSTLERLRTEAAKTGDHSKVIAYKNEQKRKNA